MQDLILISTSIVITLTFFWYWLVNLNIKIQVSLIDIIATFSVLSIPTVYIVYTLDSILNLHPQFQLILISLFQLIPITLLWYSTNYSQIIYNKLNNNILKQYQLLLPVILFSIIEINLEIPSFIYFGLTNLSSELLTTFQAIGELNFNSLIILVTLILIASTLIKNQSTIKVNTNLKPGLIGGIALFQIGIITGLMLFQTSYNTLEQVKPLVLLFNLFFFIGLTFLMIKVSDLIKTSILRKISLVGYSIPTILTTIFLLSLISYINVYALIVLAFFIKYQLWTTIVKEKTQEVFSNTISYNLVNNIKTNFLVVVVFIIALMEIFKDQTIVLVLAPTNSFFISSQIHSWMLAYDPQYTSGFILLNQLTILLLMGTLFYVAYKTQKFKH